VGVIGVVAQDRTFPEKANEYLKQKIQLFAVKRL